MTVEEIDAEMEATMTQLAALRGKANYSENGRTVDVAATRTSLQAYYDWLQSKRLAATGDGGTVEWVGVAVP